MEEEYLRINDLKERGWSQPMIMKFLGDPDLKETVWDPSKWLRSTVLEMETQPHVQARIQETIKESISKLKAQ